MSYGIRSTQEQLADHRDASPTGVAIVHVDTCLPSFLNDHHNRDGECLFGVHVDGTTTNREVLEGLRLEYTTTGDRVLDHVEDSEVLDAIDNLFIDSDLSALFAPHLERPPVEKDFGSDDAFSDAQDDWEMSEQVQAWFVLTWPTGEGDAD